MILPLKKASACTRLLIYGAGECGQLIVKEVRQHPELNYSIAFLIDDNRSIQGAKVEDINIISCQQAATLIEDYDEILIAIPSASITDLQEITDWCTKIEKPFRIIPGYYQLLNNMAIPGIAREVTLEDLLGRRPRKIDIELLKEYFSGVRVLVTGAGGSIGSELARQVIQLVPESLYLQDSAETNLFFVNLDVRDTSETAVIPLLGNLCDRRYVQGLLTKYKPHIIFHAAAYKHVPMLERNVCSALLNNLISTRNLLDIASSTGVSRFVMISTDKAVRPSSVMGVTKRLCEFMVRSDKSLMESTIVRFGNVLGSSGSLIPIVKRQISRGNSVTITDKRMRRFFMSIPEAVSLVLHVGIKGLDGNVYVLDMGKDHSILEIIEQIIRLAGFQPYRDIEIVETGIRPGEKLIEELTYIPGTLELTDHPSIGMDLDDPPPPEDFEHWLENLIKMAHEYREEDVLSQLSSFAGKIGGELGD